MDDATREGYTNTAAKAEREAEKQRYAEWGEIMDVSIYVFAGLAVISGAILSYVAFTGWKSKESVALWSLYATIVFVVTGSFIYFQKRIWEGQVPQVANDPFMISVEGSLLDVTPPEQMPVLLFQRGKIIFPAQFVVFVRLINLQSKPVMIDSITVEIQPRENEWLKLERIDGRTGNLLFRKENPAHEAWVMSHEGKEMSALLADNAIFPNIPVRGWMYLSFKGTRLRPINNSYRFTVADAEGKTFTKIVTPKNVTDPLQMGGLKPTQTVDIRSYAYSLNE
jgi:hypothetical protein